MYGGMLAGYRFNEETDGYIGIPCMRININYNAGKGFFWLDKNGDGQETDPEIEEFATMDRGEPFCIYADQSGNIFRGQSANGFSYWKMTGIDANGVPQYGPRVIMQLPKDMNRLRRIYYDDKKDELYLMGFSSVYPGDEWMCAGSTIVKFKNALQRINQGQIDIQSWVPDLLLYVPFTPESKDNKAAQMNTKAFAVEGDFIFCSLYRDGFVAVYDNKTGEYKGYIKPGPEVGNASGWTDFNYAISARKNDDGSYFILNEENAFAKVILYKWENF
jgi:hypothetical protein